MYADSSTTDELNQFLANCQQRVEVNLQQLLNGPDQAAEKLQQAMAYASLNGGKRIRPMLVYASARAVGSDLERADNAAAAVELVHCYSLVHDDLPAMDDDSLRRGKPTVHIAFDEATAILVGDALLTLAFQTLADAEHSGVSAPACLAMVRSLARASGHLGMVAGQVLDFEAVGKPLDMDQLKTMHALKTGALISASVELGALSAPDPDQNCMATLQSYAKHVGLAFQIQDDILDVTGDTHTLGKPQGADQAMNKPTYTSIAGLEAARSHAMTLANAAVADLEELGQEAELLRKLAHYIVERIN
jgi:geranylgeranyl diphosphate synthase type II